MAILKFHVGNVIKENERVDESVTFTDHSTSPKCIALMELSWNASEWHYPGAASMRRVILEIRTIVNIMF